MLSINSDHVNTMTANQTERPAYPTYHVSQRELTHLWRRQAAWDLANNSGNTSLENVDKAASLLNRIIRYAMADARHWELDNDERFSGKKWFVHQGDLLDARRDKLNHELAEFGAILDNAGLYPSVVDLAAYNDGHKFHEVASLHFF